MGSFKRGEKRPKRGPGWGQARQVQSNPRAECTEPLYKGRGLAGSTGRGQRAKEGQGWGESVFPYLPATLSFALVSKASVLYNLNRNHSVKGNYTETSKDQMHFEPMKITL